jgi:hypothetical protein
MSYYWESVNHDAPRERITDDAMEQILDAGEAGGWNVTREDDDTVRAVGKLGGTVRHYVRRGVACDCDTTEYLPCELHAETLAQWNGSSSRSADQLACIAVRELVRATCEHRNPGHDHHSDTSLSSVHGCESLILSDDDMNALFRVERETSRDPFTSWADDRDAADAVREMCDELERGLPAGVVAHWDDGFTLWRITGGPLL